MPPYGVRQAEDQKNASHDKTKALWDLLENIKVAGALMWGVTGATQQKNPLLNKCLCLIFQLKYLHFLITRSTDCMRY